MLIYYDPCFLAHAPGMGHPEQPARLHAIFNILEASDLPYQLVVPPEATRDQLELVHKPSYLDQIFSFIQGDQRKAWDGDTVISEGTIPAALKAAGSAIAAVDAIMQGQDNIAFCAVRPPGHHAEPDTAMGFCIFNNIAIAAKYARQAYGLERVAIIDFDVHHGNGTQSVCQADEGLFYASTHQANYYPGTGMADETGVFDNIMNFPLPAGTRGRDICDILEKDIFPKISMGNIDFLMLSSGFDGHQSDPLGGFDLSDDDYYIISRMLYEFAQEKCQGRLLSVLEGGYNIDTLGSSVLSHLSAFSE